MAHLNERLCLVPFSELTDCPEGAHHAIGSPHFATEGMPLFSDPVVVAVRSDIVDESLPRCSGIAVSCNTRPYQSYGPVIRRIFEESQPHKYPKVRQGMEGVMEVGGVRSVPPGGLIGQTESILMGCVAPMTGNTTQEIINTVLHGFAKEFTLLPLGATLRMPLIGTGTARGGETTEEIYRDTVHRTTSTFSSALLPSKKNIAPRRLLLVHPFEYESRLIATMLAEKAIFLTILDKLRIFTTDRRFIYGIAHGLKTENQIVQGEKFNDALDEMDCAIECLLKGERKKALKEAAKAVEIEPELRGMYFYISTLADRKEGILNAITKEALSLASEGRVRDAYCVAQALNQLGGEKKHQGFVTSLRDGYMRYSIAGMEARLLYEKYMETEEAIRSVYQGASLNSSSFHESAEETRDTIRVNLLENLEPLHALEKKIPLRIVENTFHIVVRKFMADQIELQGAERALHNLRDLKTHKKITLDQNNEESAEKLFELAKFIKENRENMSATALRKSILEKLMGILPWHGTFRLEAGRYYLSHHQASLRGNSVTRTDIAKAWEHLSVGYGNRPRDYGILSYLGFIVLLQGHKFFPLAEEFFNLFAKLLDDELTHGRFGLLKITSPQGRETVSVPLRDELSQQAYDYYENYRNNAETFAKLAKALTNSEGTAALSLYKEAIQSLSEIGRYDLACLYEEVLGETWVALLCRNQKGMGTIPLPFGEVSLDFIVTIYKKVRYWWRYSHLPSSKIKGAVKGLIEEIGKKIMKN